MHFYYCFYCRACRWYNTTGKKDSDTLRLSALSLVSSLPTLNILTLIFVISLVCRHTYMKGTGAIIIYATFFISNLLLINRKKSEILRNEYELLPSIRKQKTNFLFYAYIVFTLVTLISIVAYSAY